MNDAFQLEPVATSVKAVVKWYNPTKGFGFVQAEDVQGDAFLHVSTLNDAGLQDLPEGSEITCDLAQGRKGFQVMAITSVDKMGEAQARAPRPEVGDPVEGTVKFFNAEKGFGFLLPDNGNSDVFLSARVLERCGINPATIKPETRVRFSQRDGQKGPVAEEIELI